MIGLDSTRACLAAAAGMVLMTASFASPASAADMYGSMKDAPAEPASDLTLAASVSLTTDYVFRGISQTDENPAAQATFDATYKKFYAGFFASNLDFGGAQTPSGEFVDVADLEIDFYGGIRPTWNKFTFDFGVIYYAYPNAFDPGGDLDYVELKAGVSTTIFEKLAIGTTGYYSPDNTGEIGDNFVLESTAAYTFNKVWMFTPVVSGVYGYQWGDEDEGGFDYAYWNVGLNLAFYEKPTLSFDIRYWDTDLDGCDDATLFQCDERVVGTFKVAF